MIINAKQILELIAPEMPPIPVRHSSGELAFTADYDRVIELCLASQVCGRCRGRNSLRYLELIVPLDQVCKPFEDVESRGGMVAEDSRTIDCSGATAAHRFRICATFGPRLVEISRLPSRDLLRLPAHVVRSAYVERVWR